MWLLQLVLAWLLLSGVATVFFVSLCRAGHSEDVSRHWAD